MERKLVWIWSITSSRASPAFGGASFDTRQVDTKVSMRSLKSQYIQFPAISSLYRIYRNGSNGRKFTKGKALSIYFPTQGHIPGLRIHFLISQMSITGCSKARNDSTTSQNKDLDNYQGEHAPMTKKLSNYTSVWKWPRQFPLLEAVEKRGITGYGFISVSRPAPRLSFEPTWTFLDEPKTEAKKLAKSKVMSDYLSVYMQFRVLKGSSMLEHA